eukprot:6175124-Pleurochrysis_carterae.AAC.5
MTSSSPPSARVTDDMQASADAEVLSAPAVTAIEPARNHRATQKRRKGGQIYAAWALELFQW